MPGGDLGPAEADITSCPSEVGVRTELGFTAGGFGPAEADITSWPTDVGARLELRGAGTVFCPPGIDSGTRMGRGDARGSLGPSGEGGREARGPTGARANRGSKGTDAAVSFAGRSGKVESTLGVASVWETPWGIGKEPRPVGDLGFLLPQPLWPSMSATRLAAEAAARAPLGSSSSSSTPGNQ